MLASTPSLKVSRMRKSLSYFARTTCGKNGITGPIPHSRGAIRSNGSPAVIFAQLASSSARHATAEIELAVLSLMLGVKMPRLVFPIEHPDDDAEEDRDHGHAGEYTVVVAPSGLPAVSG